MIRTRWARVTAATVAAAGLMVGTMATAGAQSGGEDVKITGSSTVEPITSLAAEIFSEDNPDVAIRVDGPGTGDGAELFCSAEPGQWDATDGSRPLKEEELADCAANGIDVTELTLGIDGLTIVVNQDSKLKCVDPQQIYALFGPESGGGEVDLADAQALAEELGSTNTKLPSGTFTKFTPGPESGTYDSFIEINYEDILEERLEAGEVPSDKTDTNDEGELEVTEPLLAAGTFPNDNDIVKRVEGTDDGIGFFGFAYYTENSGELKAVKVYNADEGKCVKPTAKTIQNGTYPISRELFINVDDAKVTGNKSFKSYMDFLMTEESLTDLVTEAGYVPLDEATREAMISTYESIG